MFDLETYWKRRKHVIVTKNEEGEITSATPAPLRGQGGYPPVFLARWTEEDHNKGKCTKEQVGMERHSRIKLVFTGKTFIPMNRKQRRHRLINRHYTNKKGFKEHRRNEIKNPPLELPKYPPMLTNYQRHKKGKLETA